MKIDITKVIDEVDRCLFKRMDLTESQLRSLSKWCMVASSLWTAYMLISIRHQRKENERLNRIAREIEELKNAKGE